MKKILAFAMATVAVSASQAQIASLTGNIEEVAKPADAQLNVYESSQNVRVWLEDTLTLSADLTGVDAVSAGTYQTNADLGNFTIASGTFLSSYMLHFDPLGSGAASYNGSVTFEQKIIGVFVRDARLDGSDAVLGGGTLYYTGGNRGWEPASEDFAISVGEYTISISGAASSPMDEYRVVTEGVPEPATMTILGLGALAAATRKRFKKA